MTFNVHTKECVPIEDGNSDGEEVDYDNDKTNPSFHGNRTNIDEEIVKVNNNSMALDQDDTDAGKGDTMKCCGDDGEKPDVAAIICIVLTVCVVCVGLICAVRVNRRIQDQRWRIDEDEEKYGHSVKFVNTCIFIL